MEEKKKRFNLWYVWLITIPILLYFAWVGGDNNLTYGLFKSIIYSMFYGGLIVGCVKIYRVYKDKPKKSTKKPKSL